MGDLEKTSDLIDVSSEDDSLLLKSPLLEVEPVGDRSSENQERSDTTNLAESTGTFEQTDQVPQLFKSPEPERTIRNGKYNLRKSLAWDNAFFTNAGVLDPEELSCMMGGVEKGMKNLLPGIQEDVQRSTESMSSLESDNLTLESLEADLFEDIRASIKKSSKLSKAAKSSRNSGSGGEETQTIRTSKMDLASQSKEVPKPTPKKPLVSRLGSGKTTKPLSVCPETPKCAATRGVATPSVPNPHKVLGNGTPVTSLTPRRASLSSERMKKEMEDAKGRGPPVSKTSAAISGSRSNAPRPAPIRSLKSSTLGTSNATKIDPRSSCSSFGSSGSASSDNKSKPSVNPIKKKVDLRTANVSSSGLPLKPLSRPKTKITSGTSQASAQQKSVKASPSNSPASSISDWSSESFASTSTVNQRSSSSRTSIDSSKVFTGSDAPQVVPFGSRNGSQATGMLGRGIKKGLTGTTTHPALGKPSGLRLPSPKIGFFDGAKSLNRTPNGSTQSSPGGISHRAEAGQTSRSENPNKVNTGKFQPVRTVAGKGNTKPNTQQKTSSPKLKSPTPPEPSTASKKINSASRSMASSPAVPRKVQSKISPKNNEESHIKLEKVKAKESDIAIMHVNPKVSVSAEDGMELKSSSCNASSNEDTLPAMIRKDQNNISLETNGENHLEAEVADGRCNGSILNKEASTDTRIPLAVRDSFCNRDDSPDDTTISAKAEEKIAALSLPERKMENM